MTIGTTNRETLEGFVVDIACLRKVPAADIERQAKEHTTKCALMGHCIESGYGLIDEQGKMTLLDSGATPFIVALLKNTKIEKGVQLRVEREEEEGEMKSSKVLLINKL